MMGRAHCNMPATGAAGPGTASCTPSCTLTAMPETNPLDELRARIGEALRGSPAQDLEKNLHAMLAAFFDRFDLAAREDLDVHRKLLELSLIHI